MTSSVGRILLIVSYLVGVGGIGHFARKERDKRAFGDIVQTAHTPAPVTKTKRNTHREQWSARGQ